MDFTSLGVSLIASVTAVALSSVATGNSSSSSIDDIMNEYINLHVYGWIRAPRYLRTKLVNETTTFTDSEIEEVGNMSIEEEDVTDELSTTRFSAKNHILVTKRRYRVKPSAMQLLDHTTYCSLESLNPVNFYSDILTLKGQNITPSNIVVSGLVGEKGEQGTKGEMGMVGTKGEKGVLGIKGTKGDQGLQGPIGENGLDGKDGAKGAKGIEGKVGIVGLTGISFDFVKIWPDQATKDTDEGTVPRPPDFPGAGQYGLVSDDGKVYLSDGLDLTEVDDISEQGANGEVGEKGEKGAVGTAGDSGVSGLAGTKGSIGEKGFIGLTGLVQGNKGMKGESASDGSPGEFGENGPSGAQGPVGDFSMDGFEEIVKPTITSIVQGTPGTIFTINVLNPVYSLPVNVWAYTTTFLNSPSAQQIQDNGTLINVLVDTNGVGNGLFTNPTPGTTRYVWFTWTDNDGDLQDVLGPFDTPQSIIRIKSPDAHVYTLYIDGKQEGTLSHSGNDQFEQIGNGYSPGQSYEIRSLTADVYCATVDGSDPESGTLVSTETNVEFICYQRVSFGLALNSNQENTNVVMNVFFTPPRGSGWGTSQTIPITQPQQNFIFDLKVPIGSVLAFVPQTKGLFVPSQDFTVTFDGILFNAYYQAFQVSVDLNNSNGSFQFLINGSSVETSFYVSNYGTFPYYLTNGDTYQVIPIDGSECKETSGNGSGTIASANVLVEYDCDGVEFIVNFTGNNSQPVTFSLTLNSMTCFATFTNSPGVFLEQGQIGDTYSIASLNNCTSSNSSGTVTSSDGTTIHVDFECTPPSQTYEWVVSFNNAPQTFTLEVRDQFTNQIIETKTRTFNISPFSFEVDASLGNLWSISSCCDPVGDDSGIINADTMFVEFECSKAVFPGPLSNSTSSGLLQTNTGVVSNVPPEGLYTQNLISFAPVCDGKSCVANNMLAKYNLYPFSMNGLPLTNIGFGQSITLNAGTYGHLFMSSNSTLTLVGNQFIFNEIVMSDNCTIVTNDNTILYSSSATFVGFSSTIGTSQRPITLWSNSNVLLNQSAVFIGAIYTNEDLQIENGATLAGAATAEGDINLFGSALYNKTTVDQSNIGLLCTQ